MLWRVPYLHLRCLLSSTWYLLRLFCFYSLELYGGTIIQLTSRSTLGGMSLIFASGVGRSANRGSRGIPLPRLSRAVSAPKPAALIGRFLSRPLAWLQLEKIPARRLRAMQTRY